MEYVEIVRDEQEILAIIIRSNYSTEGIQFFTPENFSQQLAFMHHKKGKKIKPHKHNALTREIIFTQEVLVLRKGKLKVDIYRNDRSHFSTVILDAGDVILLASGGHGFEILEDIQMIEIKQGPYAGDMDKVHFEEEI